MGLIHGLLRSCVAMTVVCGAFLFLVAIFRKSAILSPRWLIMAETVILGESGRIVLPASVRKEFGLKTGDRLTVSSEQGSIRILNRKMALESIRADILKQRGNLHGILDEFLAERREEARREAENE